jgi:putative transposase
VLDDAYLRCAARYVALNPVRAGLAGRAEDYPWSSAAAHLGMRADPLVRHPKRLLEYVPDFAELLRLPQDRESLDLMRRHERTGRPLGDAAFLERLERRLHRGLVPGKAGRKPRDGWK